MESGEHGPFPKSLNSRGPAVQAAPTQGTTTGTKQQTGEAWVPTQRARVHRQML